MYVHVHASTCTCVNLHTIITYALTCTCMSACKDDHLISSAGSPIRTNKERHVIIILYNIMYTSTLHFHWYTCVNIHIHVHDTCRGDQLKSSYLPPGSLIHTTREIITYSSIETPLSHYSLCVSYEHVVFAQCHSCVGWLAGQLISNFTAYRTPHVTGSTISTQ